MDRSRGWSLTATHKERGERTEKGQSTRDTSGNWRDQRANVSRRASAPNESSSAAVEKMLRMRSGLGYAAVEGSVHATIRDYAADTGDSLDGCWRREEE